MLSNCPILCHPLLLLGVFCMQVLLQGRGHARQAPHPRADARHLGGGCVKATVRRGRAGCHTALEKPALPPLPPWRPAGSWLCPIHLVRLCLVCPTTEPASPVRLTGSAHRTAAGLPSPASVFPSVEWVEAGGEPDPKMCRSLERCPDPFFFFFQS